ncbi:hypothetical protein HGP14_01245 [Rhizobium sp. P32RR-XVIII]|uniref:hypothetical protein n=1 Tax=Rhizobium sp. P32RR-XVIII TaxID=2726738 RepID=UPI00145754D9|nr:hypothetical protein [Rhizobium sp. P32RR-XVIII]NLS01995.1 hypothetical protein [Rhizobium sp. P32RR-XVIII]
MKDTDTLVAVQKLLLNLQGRDKNEAETRHKIIDVILHDVFSWPKNRVAVEEHISPGYADYILKKTNGDDLLFIEAKKEGVYFDLPAPYVSKENYGYLSIAKLRTDENIRAAMDQVRNYCFDTGCEFAAITNGHEWVFFKTFEKGKRFENLQAFVIRNIQFFEKDFTKAQNTFSFTSIFERSSLHEALSSAPPKDRLIFFPKEKIPSYSHTITANRLAGTLRPVVNHYFGVIGDGDTEFMDRCYVSQRDYANMSDGITVLIEDSLTPYFKSYGVSQLDETGRGGQLGGRLTKNIKRHRQGEVLVLFGGKGAGKSTFIKRLLKHNPPPWLREHSVIAIVDLLKVPEDVSVIRETIWDSLVTGLDRDGVLDLPRDKLLSGLFSDRFEIAKRQDLAGLNIKSEAYNMRLNALVASWKNDKPYCAKRLADYWSGRSKGVIVVVDNTDQYASETQDFCFTSSQEISNLLFCVTLISMREERFHNSKIHGLLDAFQNSGFHISSPKPSTVFKKRLSYTNMLLSDKSRRRGLLASEVSGQLVDDCVKYLSILSAEFGNDKSPLNGFLTACAHGDIRLSLDLFRSFLLSGYTNVDEMLASGSWTFKIHQIIKPVMIPNRYFYDENLSDIPNAFQVRHTRHGSHFTALRILRKLAKNVERSMPAYMSAAELKAYFVNTFNMADDFASNLDVLLKHGFVESNNRLDRYADDLDSVKITNYGLYMVRDLAYYFTYLDLVCTDCGIFSEQVSNYLVEAARKEYDLFSKGERLERITTRLDRVEKFIDYLADEESRERELYSLGMKEDEMFTAIIKRNFASEKEIVMRSAKRNTDPRPWKTKGRRRA